MSFSSMTSKLAKIAETGMFFLVWIQPRTGLTAEALEPGLGRALEADLPEHHEFVGDVTPTYANPHIGAVTSTYANRHVGAVTPTYANRHVGDVTPTYAECDTKGECLLRTERGARYLNDLQALFLASGSGRETCRRRVVQRFPNQARLSVREPDAA